MASVEEIRRLASAAGEEELECLRRSLSGDERKGVLKALESAERRISAEKAERARVDEMYSFQAEVVDAEPDEFILGLDEVGRGPIAGPLAVGAVVLPSDRKVYGLNDSKQLSACQREALSEEIRAACVASVVCYATPQEIDRYGISHCLKSTFSKAIEEIDSVVPGVVHILLDGNPLRLDPREVNVVKGDAKCASIAAASIIAKVDRDAYMERLDGEFPEYGFAGNKGYGTAEHMDALRKHGPCAEHRLSFCSGILQETLF